MKLVSYRDTCSASSIRSFGKGGRKSESNKNQNKNFSTQNRFGFPVQNQMKIKKKGLHSNLVRLFAQIWVQAKNKGLRLPFVCSNLLSKFHRGGPCGNFAYYSMLIVLSWRPKGGAWPNAPPKYATVFGQWAQAPLVEVQ